MAVARGDHEIEVAVVVVVGGGQAAPDGRRAEVGAVRPPGVRELSVAVVLEQERPLRVGDDVAVQGDVVHRVAVGHHDVQVAVVVVIEHVRPPAGHQEAHFAQTGRVGVDRKEPLAPEVAIELVRLVAQVGHEQVLPAVAIQIARVGPHAGLRLTVLAAADPGLESDVGEPAVAVVPVQRVDRRVVGDVEILVAVRVVVEPDDAQSLAVRVPDAGGARHLLEFAVPLVVIQHVGQPAVGVGMTVRAPHCAHVAAELLVVHREVDVIRHEQIEAPVVVVVGPGRARGVETVLDARLLGHVGERAVAVVAVQDRRAEVRDIQVLVPVVVIVACGAAVAVSRRVSHAGLVGHVDEGAVPLVPEQAGVGRPGRARGPGQRPALNEKEILPAVAVVIQEADARGDRLDVVLPPRSAVDVNDAREPRRGGHIAEGDRRPAGVSSGAGRRRQDAHGQDCADEDPRSGAAESPHQ